MTPKSIPIELKFKDLQDNNFINTLKGLVNHKFDDFTTAYALKKILDKIDSESAHASKLWHSHVSKLELVPTTDGSTPNEPVDKEAFKKFSDNFAETKCEVGNRFKLHINDLIGYKLSAVEMGALTPVVYGFEVLEKEGDQNGKEKSN